MAGDINSILLWVIAITVLMGFATFILIVSMVLVHSHLTVITKRLEQISEKLDEKS